MSPYPDCPTCGSVTTPSIMDTTGTLQWFCHKHGWFIKDSTPTNSESKAQLQVDIAKAAAKDTLAILGPGPAKKGAFYCSWCGDIFGKKKRKRLSPEEKLDKLVKSFRGTNLHQQVANFYSLELMASEGNSRAEGLLLDLEARLAKNFAIYLNIAVAGELRHGPQQARKDEDGDLPRAFYDHEDECEDAEMCEDHMVCHYCNESFEKPSSGFPHEWFPKNWLMKHGPDRHQFWANWLKVSKSPYGDVDKLELIHKGFNNLYWRSGFGGEAWATITLLLLRYRRGEVPTRVFVDQVFHLQHNGGCVLDKAYSTGGIYSVLEAQGKSKLKELLGYASPRVQELWDLHRAEKAHKERLDTIYGRNTQTYQNMVARRSLYTYGNRQSYFGE